MKVLALNSSPRKKGESLTGLMLDHLALGMIDAGAEVEIVDLRKKKINNCIGCFTCWTKTPGKCVHKDDMTDELFPKWLMSDIVVYATPLYHYTVNAEMKRFIERTLPVAEPFFVKRGEKTSHPIRKKPPSAVILSVAGFPELSVFDELSHYVNFLYGRGNLLLAEIYRPAAHLLAAGLKAKTEEILEATKQAGRELVEKQAVSTETMAKITAPIMDYDLMAKAANMFFKSCIREGVTVKEFGEKGMIPRPESTDEFMTLLLLGFNPKAAGDMRATFQFHFSGDVSDSCYFIIDKGTIEAKSGISEKHDLTIKTPFDIWMDIVTKAADGQKMFMDEKYQVEGDISLLMKIGELFGDQG